jgi:hypothetical protein
VPPGPWPADGGDDLQRRLHPRPAAQDARTLSARALGRTVKARSGLP